MQIMSTLLNINGSMKEFSEDIESRLHKAFKSKAGKKHGMSEIELEMRKLKTDDGFSKHKESLRNVEKMIKNFMTNGGFNSRFFRKNVAN